MSKDGPTGTMLNSGTVGVGVIVGIEMIENEAFKI
jgi:hypothetical protein